MYPEFKDFIVIITGAASGIGMGTAKLFIEEGATVISPDIDEEGLNKAAAELVGRCILFLCSEFGI